MIVQRKYHTATLLADGRVLVVGGEDEFDHKNLPLATEIYNPSTGKWAAIGKMNISRRQHTATLLPSGNVLVAGGSTPAAVTSAELFDPKTGTWKLTGSLITRHSLHTATLLPDGKVLVASGRANSAAELYDPASGSWSVVGQLTTPRAYHTATMLPNGDVLFVGGTQGKFRPLGIEDQFLGAESLESVEVYGRRTSVSGGTLISPTPPVTAINLHAPQKMPDGAFQLAFENLPNAKFTVIATTNLLLPNSAWIPIGVVTEIAPGSYRFIDQEATNWSQRFYRIRSP
jgi:hypothetical protein